MIDKFVHFKHQQPGPGDYQTQSSENSRNIGIRMKHKTELDFGSLGRDSPGPCNYNICSDFSSRTAWTLGK